MPQWQNSQKGLFLAKTALKIFKGENLLEDKRFIEIKILF